MSTCPAQKETTKQNKNSDSRRRPLSPPQPAHGDRAHTGSGGGDSKRGQMKGPASTPGIEEDKAGGDGGREEAANDDGADDGNAGDAGDPATSAAASAACSAAWRSTAWAPNAAASESSDAAAAAALGGGAGEGVTPM